MKREEIATFVLKEIINILGNLENNERLWILNVQLPQYICFECGNDTTDCNCGDV